MAKPTLAVVMGYLDEGRKVEGHIAVITLAGRRILIPQGAIEARHSLEAGGSASGPFRFFVSRDAIINTEMRVSELIEGETHWASDTARPARLDLRTSRLPDDGSTHWASDTA